MADRILILGASARAAAASARRAGFVPFAVDLFADRDTQLLCEQVWRCPPESYPAGLFRLADHAPPMPWVYTGGLENYPELVGELAARRELWGNGPDVLRRVRNPAWLAEQPHPIDAFYPEVAVPGGRPPESGTWMRKPLRGAGGRGVRIADEADYQGISDPTCQYFLQAAWPTNTTRADRAGSVVFRDWRPVGYTMQLTGTPWLHAAPFAYAGSVSWMCTLTEAVRLMYGVRSLHGIWGMDIGIFPGPNYSVIYEVNPRYPASVEVIEFATGRSCLTGKAQGPRSLGLRGEVPRQIVGKAVYYAPHRLTVPMSGPWDESLRRAADVWHRPDFADVPHPGDVIEPGHPVLTILADADTESDCLARLRTRAAELDQLFGHTPNPEPE